MPEGIPPTEQILALMKEGKTTEQIFKSLKDEGYNLQQINEGINQAKIKKGVEGEIAPSAEPQGGKMAEEQYQPSEEMQVSELEKEPEIPVPTPTQAAPAGQTPPGGDYGTMPSPEEMAYAAQQQPAMPDAGYGASYEDIQSLVEEVIDEKWREFMGTIGDITTWKSQMADETEAIKQEILRIQARFDNLQAAVLGKVDEYSKGVTDIGSEMKALEKVFEKIIEPLSSNIKELAKITEELRTKKK